MPALWIAQLLCPQRHAICALAYDSEQTPRGEIETHLRVAGGLLGAQGCGLCGSRELHVEHGKLPSDDWNIMRPLLEAAQEANLATRAHFDRIKGSTN